MLTRDGPLVNAADWSHHEANPANTAASLDRRVGGELKRLWFEGSLRWQKKLPETEVRIAGGRMFVVDDVLRAFDAYTGRPLWKRPMTTRPGNLIALPDALYVPGGGVCAVHDPATGKRIAEIDFPADAKGYWSSLRATEDLLVGASGQRLACVDRKTQEARWTAACENPIVSIAVGGGRVFCCDAVNQRRGQLKPTEPTGTTSIPVG